MPIMIERIIHLTVDDIRHPSFLCTPESLDELAIGYLLTQGLIRGKMDVRDIQADGSSVKVHTRDGLLPPLSMEDRLASLVPVKADRRYSFQHARALMGRLMDVDGYFGTHCLGLQTPDGEIFREDIGRHNAMDKVIGHGVLNDIDFSRCAVAATGRISLEMLVKAASAGIPYVISKKYPSDLAVLHAERLGVCIIGHAGGERPQAYAMPGMMDEADVPHT